MPRASEAPFALVDIVRCSKSWTIVDAVRCLQCSPTNGHQEEDGFRDRSLEKRQVPRAITRKKMPCCSAGKHREEHGFRERSPPGRRRTWMSSHGSLPKNLIAAHSVQGSQADEGSGGTALPLLRARRVTGRESQRAAEMWFLSGAVAEDSDLD